MLRRVVSVLLIQRPGAQTAVGSRIIWGVCHGDRHGGSTAERLLRSTLTLHLSNRLAPQRCVSNRGSSWQECSIRTTGCRSFTAGAEPELDDSVHEADMSSTLRKALASHFPRTDDHQVQPVLFASLTKLLCKPPAPELASIGHVSVTSQTSGDTEETTDSSSSTQGKASVEELSSGGAAESPADRELAKKQAAYRYATAQRERYKASVAKFRSKRPQQDFTRYHEKLKAEAKAARDSVGPEEGHAAPPHPPEAMQELASVVASVLWKDEHEVSALLRKSAYGRQQAPAPLPDPDQVKATLQEMLRIFAAITKFNAVNTVWLKVLGRNPTLLSCSVDQIQNTVSFLEMLDMAPAQIAVCLSKAPVLLSQNLEDKLLPLCDYLNRIGLDLSKQRTLVTWRPEVLSQRLDWVQGQCALLAGYGIQGDVLANVLYKSGTLIMVPRTNLGLRLKYLYGELGCTAEDIRRGAGIVGFEAAVVAFRVTWLKHIGRKVQIPSEVPGGMAGWKQHVEQLRGKAKFGPEEPIPLWIAVRCTLRWLCIMLEYDFREAQKFEREWRSSEEAKRWAGSTWKKKTPVLRSTDSQPTAAQDPHA